MSSIDGVPNESRVAQVLIGIIVPNVISTIFVLARLYTRCIITRNWGWDDTFISIAWVTSIGLAVASSLFVKFGLGHHQVFQALSEVIPTIKLAFISRVIYQFALCMTKVGICVFYLRVFQDRRSKQWVYLIVGFVVITSITNEFVFIFLCNPVSDAWSISSPNCKSTVPSTDANAVCHILADVFLMIFVIPRVLPLQMNHRQKASLLLVVSLGVLVIAASIARTVLVVSLENDPDLAWNGYTITTWTTIEVSTGLFCASAPCIRPLLRQITPGFLSSGLSRSQTSATGLSKSKPYGNGSVAGGGIVSLSTILNSRRRDRSDAYELKSVGDEEAGLNFSARTAGKPWTWVGKGSSSFDSRPADESEAHFAEGRDSPSGNDILKTSTVSVTVEEGSTIVSYNNEKDFQRGGDTGPIAGSERTRRPHFVDGTTPGRRQSHVSSGSESEDSKHRITDDLEQLKSVKRTSGHEASH